MKIKDVVIISEGRHPQIGFPHTSKENAAMFLVSRLFTDAIFNGDIRSITTIINRIDGGLPKDSDIAKYQTLFGDCINEVLEMDDARRLMVHPEDSVIMAMCKSLYDLAVQDIYWDPKHGRKIKPTVEKKQERDNAMRIILERAGGRKTLSSIPEAREELDVADWLKELPESNDV